MLIQGAGSHDWTISNSVKFCLVTGSLFLPAYKCDIIIFNGVSVCMARLPRFGFADHAGVSLSALRDRTVWYCTGLPGSVDPEALSIGCCLRTGHTY